MRRQILPILVIIGSACAPEAPTGEWVITIDTLNGGAGPIRIVNVPPAGGEGAVTWLLEEDVRIGGEVEGPTSFGQISQIAVDRQGRIAALDYLAQDLR